MQKATCRLLVAFLSLAMANGGAAAEGKPPQLSANAVILENQTCRYEIGLNGDNLAFVNPVEQKNYCEPGTPFMIISKDKKAWRSSKVSLQADAVTVSFGDSGCQVKARIEIRPRYFLVTLQEVTGPPPDWVQLCGLSLSITESVGTLVNAAWNERFGACVLACNDRTHSFGASTAKAALTARAYSEFGLAGAKIAVIAAPTAAPDPADKMLDAIEQVELEQGLPHPTINGVWIKRAKERFASYLMAHGVSEENIDEVIEFARNGFGCVEFYPWSSTPSYRLNPKLFPNGLAGLKTVADKIHAAGMQVGLHTMQAMVGWGAKNDPYISPKADPRLLQDRYATLASALGPQDTEVKVKESIMEWPEEGDLYVAGEIIRYKQRTPTGFAQCQRGLHGTTVTEHNEGTRVGHLVNCFKMWGNCVYAPDLKTDMADEVCENIARVFNEVGADMTYFDGGEELTVQPPHWRSVGFVGLGVMKRLRKPVVLEGNAVYTHHSWHVVSRGSPHFDPIYFGRREYTLRFKGQNPAHWKKNLLTGDVGWFAPHAHSESTYAVTPDEVMLLCLKALGGKAPISFSVPASNLYANKRMRELLDIIRTCDELKRLDYFSENICKELTTPMAEHVLEQTPDRAWAVRPMQFGPAGLLHAQRPPSNEMAYNNPYAAQAPWLRLRAHARLAPYGSKDNIVLADPKDGVPFKAEATASADLVQEIEASPEKTPDGGAAFCYRAANKAKGRSGWCRAAMSFAPTLNLSSNRRPGLWLRTEPSPGAEGGILNVQLLQGYGARDHYIPLNFRGWKYIELDQPEDSRFYAYKWPYGFIDLMYWPYRYGTVKGLNLFYNDLPPQSQVACLIGRIEALREYPEPLKNPAIEVAGQRLRFPVSLKPDEYVEVDWDGKCRHFEPNGGLMADVSPEGRLRLSHGDNRARFLSDTGESASPRAELTLAVRGEALHNERKVASPIGPEPAQGMSLLPDGSGGLRLTQGLYELVGRESSHTIVAFDGKSNRWTVENPTSVACKGAIAIGRGGQTGTQNGGHGVDYDADYDDPKALLLERFDDLAPYEMSTTNQFERYVIGGGKQLLPCGPVRADVTQTFRTATDDARAGTSSAVYTAVNSGAAGGWCAKGKRFTPPLDLSRHEGIAFWLHGDAKKETLRFQFRDVAGASADWLIPIDFTGWRLMVLRAADAPNFDWGKVEYVIFYFNNIPAQTSVTMKLDDLKAVARLRAPSPLSGLLLKANGQTLRIPADLGPREWAITDGAGMCSVWKGLKRERSLPAPESTFRLQPGANQFELLCNTSQTMPRNVTVRVIRLGPALNGIRSGPATD